MPSKKPSLLTISSLSKLCNIYYSSRNIVGCNKTLNTLKTISTAAERSDFPFSAGYNIDDSNGYQQSREGFYREGKINTDSQANASGFCGASSVEENGKSLKHVQGYSEGLQNGYVHKLAERGGNFNGSYGYYGQNNRNMQQNLTGVCVDSSRGFGKHPNAFVENYNMTQEHRERMMQYPNAYNSTRILESQGNLRGNFAQNNGHFQQSPNEHYPGNNEMRQQYSSSGQYQQKLNYGRHHSNLNNAPMVASHISSNENPDGESAKVCNDSPYRGTLEELDCFCMEGKVKEAVEVLELLEKLHIPVDLPRYLQLMRKCGEAKSLEEAKIIHRHVLQYLSPLKVSTYNRILEMYSECGSMDDAFQVFNNMPERNLTTWDTMITQLAKNGFAEDSLDLFTQFKNMALKPDGQLFIGVFYACSMVGDIDEGMLHFESMSKDYGIVPSMAHFVSVVDMFGSIGHLDEAFEFIEKMPMEPSVEVWETLMNLCRVHGNMELGDRCAELVQLLDPSRLNEQSKAGLVPVKPSDLIKEKEKKKLASKNLLEVRSTVNEYRAGDTSHPNSDKIYYLLRGMKSQMKEAGYIPETKFVLHDVDQESKEEALLAHSERLAVASGLMNTPVRSPLRVIKNLRVCGDCHNALKIISKIVGRELIMRDAKRFHHFKDGVCSCRDYW